MQHTIYGRTKERVSLLGQCGTCEETCTHYLDIIERLRWLDQVESQLREGA